MVDFAKDKKENYPSEQGNQQTAGGSGADFATDKSENYPGAEPSTPSTGQEQVVTTPSADPEPAPTTQTTGQEQATPTTPVVKDQQPSATATVNPAENPENYTFTGEQLNKMGPAVTDEAQQAVTKYKFDWANESLDSVIKGAGKDVPIRQILDDYLKWAHDNNQPVDYFTVNDIINKSDVSVSPADAEKARLKQERKEKWDKVGNFLLHLGNVVGNVAGGGMGSVKLEDPVKWTERQRLLKEKTEALRRTNNQSIWAQMQKDAAARRDYEIKKKNAEALAAYRQGQAAATQQRANSTSQVNEAKIKWYNAKTGAVEEITPKQLEEIESRIVKNQKQGNAATVGAQARMISANKSGGGRSGSGSKEDEVKVTERYDRKGKLKGTTKSYKEKKGTTTNGKISTGLNWKTKK